MHFLCYTVGRMRRGEKNNSFLNVTHIFNLSGERASSFLTLYYYPILQPSSSTSSSLSNVYVINTPLPQWVAEKVGIETGGKKEQNNVFFSSKIPSLPLPQGFLLWATWKMGNNVATQWTPSYHMKHSSSELEETKTAEEKSCVIYDTGPCSYMGSSFMSSPRYGPHMRRGLSAVLETYSLLPSSSLCSSLWGSEEEK